MPGGKNTGAPLLGITNFGFPGAAKAPGAGLHYAPDMGLFGGPTHGAGEAKTLAMALIESSSAKLRILRLPELLGAASALAILALVSEVLVG